MPSPEQYAANRRNALKSTGPRTAEGKSASRRNSFKHGIFAEAHILIGEDQAAYQALSDDYVQRFQPATPDEETLVANLVNHSWSLVRFRRLESLTWNMRLKDPISNHPEVTAYIYAYKELEFLQRRTNSVHRQFHRDMALLNQLQAARQLARYSPGLDRDASGQPASPSPQDSASPMPAPIPQPASPQPLPLEIGFVPSNPKQPRIDPALPPHEAAGRPLPPCITGYHGVRSGKPVDTMPDC